MKSFTPGCCTKGIIGVIVTTMHYYGGYGYGFDPFFGVFHLVGTFVVVAIIIAVIMMVVRGGPRRWQRWSMHSALTILNERLAKGEIDEKEYAARKKALLEH